MKSSAFQPFTERPLPVPPTGPFRSLPDLIASHARQQPRATALITGELQLSYEQLDEYVDRVAASFQRDGCKPQDTVALCSANSNEYLVVWIGALRAGLTVVPLAPSATTTQLLKMIKDAGATYLFSDQAAAALFGFADKPLRQVRLDGSIGGASLADWMEPAGRKPEHVDIRPEWAFNIIYSSGTTGAPKGIVHPNQLRWEQIWRSAFFGYGPNSVALIATPLYSNTTLVSALPTLGRGGCLVLMPKFDAERYLQLAQQHRVTHTMLVPIQYQRLMALPSFDDYDLLSFRYKFCTSAPFQSSLKADILARWPGGLVEFYGMTEGGGSCMLFAHLATDKLHTVGQPAVGHDIRLIDEEGQEVPRGVVGEVVGRSGVMMTGYYNQPDKTAEVEWFDGAGIRFLRHGDVGRFDEDGYLVLMDRRKDLIISGGFNIYPSDLEAEIQRHPAVADVAVIGATSKEWGETPVAFVVRRDGSVAAAEDIRFQVNTGLGKTQRIAALVFIDELPRSAIGKVLKRELRLAYEGTQLK